MTSAARAVVAALAIQAMSATASSLPEGVWASRGYGEIVAVGSGSFTHYEATRTFCVSRGANPIARLEETIGTADEPGATAPLPPATVTVTRGISRYVWDRLDALPARCARAPDARPLDLFDQVWETFDEHYAFFALRGVDWAHARRTFRPEAAAAARDEDLLPILERMLAPLNDRHVRLQAGDRLFVSGRSPRPPRERDGLLRSYAAFQDALKGYLAAQDPQGTLRSAANGQIWWRRFGGGVGYVAVLSLWDMTGSTETSQAKEAAAAVLAVRDALRDLGGSRALIVDLRFNNGGSDAVGLALAGCFADRERHAFTKQAVTNGGFTEPQTVKVAVSAPCRYAGPVTVLTGPYTASAAEVMTLALRVLPRVTVVGSRTSGLFSDTLYRRLPNGWTFTLSNEVYRTPSGELFEGVGIPPAIAVPREEPPRSLAERLATEIEFARRRLRPPPQRSAPAGQLPAP